MPMAFAKIVEVFDARGIALVSVTQQFNTATSMGRLTLNVLLSFAQFERKLTAERVRDKFAASKRKGLWMGGRVPSGYDLKDRQLIVNDREAALVRSFYQRYLELGCISKLSAELITRGIADRVPERFNPDSQDAVKPRWCSVQVDSLITEIVSPQDTFYVATMLCG